jgi:serine protease Do
MRPSSAAVALSWTLLVVPGPSLAQSVELRPIDRATVRVIGVGGVQPILFQSAETGVARIPGIPNARHGSGVVVRGDGLVLTAAHVTSGADEVAVLLPGQSAALPARVVYVASDYDVAFLQIPGPVESFVTLPDRDPVLRVSDPVTASGYPLDVRERSPAAVSGTISRENNDGSLQLAMGVNPGNSGGPVVDAGGRIVGILSRRGEPGAGVESIALAVPVRHLRAALA